MILLLLKNQSLRDWIFVLSLFKIRSLMVDWDRKEYLHLV